MCVTRAGGGGGGASGKGRGREELFNAFKGQKKKQNAKF